MSDLFDNEPWSEEFIQRYWPGADPADIRRQRDILLAAMREPQVQFASGTCELCAAECRGHSLGHPEEWEPEKGSRAYDWLLIYQAKEIIGGLLDLGFQDGLVTRARAWLTVIEKEAE